MTMRLICYLSNGYPTIADSIEMAKKYVDAGCDIIEVDIPSTDPYLEGEYIATRMRHSLQTCRDYKEYMNGILEIRRNLPKTKLILLLYENTIHDIGTEKVIDFCLQNDLTDLILVGLNDETIKNLFIEKGLKVSCYVQFKMDEAEIEVAKNSNGFVYMQAKPINTAVNPKYPTLKDCIAKLRNEGIKRDIYCGVGMHTPEDIEMAKQAGADGVFVGSTILKTQHDIPRMQQILKEFKEKCGG